MRIRDEDLVQFLLGDADQNLRQRVEAGLAADPRISKRIDELRAALGLLDSLKLSAEPPGDLVSRTLMRIDSDVGAGAVDESSGESSKRELAPVHVRRNSNSVAVGSHSSRQLWDSAILSISIIVICCLMLPLVLEARSQSRRLQCAHNLNSIGRGLTELALMDSDRRFPKVPMSGADSFAGVYAVRLQDANLLESHSLLQCASLPEAVSNGRRIVGVPNLEEFYQADVEQQAEWRFFIGGDFAYSLGVIDGGRFTAPRLEGRTHFAILSDSPRIQNDQESFVAHEGRGINIFYEDGHVAFVPVRGIPHDRHLNERDRVDRSVMSNSARPVDPWLDSGDDPFRNMNGARAYGTNPNDVVLGPSYLSPLPSAASLP